MFLPLVLIAIGVIALLVKANVLSGSVWAYTWPVILILLGLSFLFGRFRRRGNWRWFGCCPPWDNRDPDKKE